MTNETVKCGLFLLGGIVIGALGATAVSRGKLKGLKPLASDVLSHGYDIRDKVLETVDGAREDVADVFAEAEAKSKARRSAASPEVEEAALLKKAPGTSAA
ncbi:hypothetical protein MAF45_01490 [Mesosutterella sp. OilRF-GAM-744-9]|uniref:DUF5132 domain-containing protein n=2 Tax=Mesosutterella TaxID=2494213 RepID=A0ABS9MNC8_9BURK|nr:MULTISPECIES: hypothetical protein [unclassified Mesosutterella]MCG5030129.1 hypothetical protein [Mesosutterella sp. oilRF-744-WT-GAM-9]MCI6530963.1 hypothetical protein [Mesosutterella sp.]MDL2060099.1 hypothetical protein [Mesosutterella sp. AGMB02718]